ncbi:PucR family transcriptional regulator [Streptomyces cavourensis]|uniref:PucR family transcriptional regulator n=1 Tax=Streptomyces sp. HNA39 TaxID=2850561 RepID=UPI00200DCAC8|nr:PucR family transcriptional regulator [Streptomyces sp. HNA39]UQA34082.1 PucR family transcriptional regulator [Streptomyces sp. HNA39]
MDESSMPPPSVTAPGPPTPPVPLAALLAREELGLRRIAGPADADLLWVHTSEMADPYPYLLGGELLLSAGVLLTDPDRYVARLVEAGAAALGFGVRPVHESVPEALVEACDRHGLPLLEVPPETPFTTIARAVWRLMAEARHRELRRVTRAQQALATAAARPDPVPAVLHQLATHLDGRALLLTATGEELHTAGRHPSPEAAAALARLAGLVTRDRPGAPASATDTAGGTQLSAYALGGEVSSASSRDRSDLRTPTRADRPTQGQARDERRTHARDERVTAPQPQPQPQPQGERLALALATCRREPGDHTVAGIAVVLLSLLTAPHRGTDAAGRSAALVRLLLGASPAEVAPLLGPEGPWTVVHARRTDGTRADTLTAGALGASLGSTLVDAGYGEGDAVRVLLQEPNAPAPQPGWTLGAATPTPLPALPTADLRAARALAHAEATRTPLATETPATGLASLIPPDRAAAHARTLLAPLTPPLAGTLRCWLSLHGSWDRTAVALAVHRNTVRQRIGRCAELLGMDLNDMDVRTELWFALRQEPPSAP